MNDTSGSPVSTHRSRMLWDSEAPFSHIVIAGAEIGHVSGIIGQDRRTGNLASSDLAEQTEAMLDNLEDLLNEIGRDLGNVVKTTLYLLDYADFQVLNAVYARRFSRPWPARTTLQVAGLPLGASVQIDAIIASGVRA